MTLTAALNSALSSLNVNQRTMAVISHNIANANTEGYDRQIVDLASISIAGTGQGVRIEDVVRKVDEYLENAINLQSSDVGRAEIVNEFMERLQIFLGEPGANNSIDEQIENFFNSLQAMAQSPERTSTRAGVVEAGDTLAREISTLAYNMEGLRMEADLELDHSVDAVNALLQKLFTLNQSLINADAFKNPKADLLNQQNIALQELSEYLDIRTYTKESGAVHIYVGQGIPLVDDVLYQLSYEKITNFQQLVEDADFGPMTISQVDPDTLQKIGDPITIATSGNSDEVTSIFSGGKMYGLLQVRDEVIPGMLDQLDMLANQLRDKFNEIHNLGTGYPGATSLTGTRLVIASEKSAWDGSIRIAVLNANGEPADPAYSDEAGVTGFRPLTLDLSQLYTGSSTLGEPDIQTIIDEINNHFSVPPAKLELGNFNQIQLAMLSDKVPGASPVINFDFDIENISGEYGDFWVTGVTVLDDTAADITNVSDTMPGFLLDPASTYVTSAASNQVVVTAASPHGLSVGDRVRLTDPGGPVDGIPGTDFDGYFTVEAVSGNTFTISTATAAGGGATTGVAGLSGSPPYATVAAGQKERLFQDGSISANLSGNTASTYYDIQVDMAVLAEDGTLSTTTVNYRIYNPQVNTRNDRITADTVIAGSGVLVPSSNVNGYLRAILVDEDGNELPKVNGEYGDQEGYLKIVSRDPNYTVAIQDLGSSHEGRPNDNPVVAGTGRAFSWYFELNNFFESNEPTDAGDTLRNSAYNMAVEQRLLDSPNLISTGQLVLSNQPANSALDPLYTYERYSGDNSIAQQLAKLGIDAIDFDAAGGLSGTTLSFNGYAGEILAHITTVTISASATYTNSQILLSGFQERADAISGVNLDEELANMIIYQNAYTASSKVIKVTDELFDTLLQIL